MSKAVDLDDYVLETIAFLRRARTPIAFSRCLCQIVNNLGFSDFDIIQLGKRNSITCILTTLPEKFYQTYFEEELHKYDLTIACLYKAKKTLFHSEVYQFIEKCPIDIDLIRKNFQSHELMEHYGYYDAYYNPMTNQHTNSKIVVSILSEGVKRQEFRRLILEKKLQISSLSKVIDTLLFQQGLMEKTVSTKTLSPAEINIMNAIGRDSMTQKQAAETLGITVRTVEKHCENIKKVLNKPTISGCLFKAIKENLI